MKLLLDAAPLLNFLAAGEVNVLIQYAAREGRDLCVPDVVDQEAQGHFTNPLNRFARTGAEGTWSKVRLSRVSVLGADLGSSYGQAVLRELRFIRPPTQTHCRKDLGEDMAMAHAAVAAIDGHDVKILIDEERAIVRFETYLSNHLERRFPGASQRISFIRTRTVVDSADPQWLTKCKTGDELYAALARFDDGLS